MNPRTDADGAEIIFQAPETGLAPDVEGRLIDELSGCPDVAFAHLVQVTVPDQGPRPQLSLFVWLVPEAVASLRAALNLVSEAVARALPEDRYLDVLVLNSAPDLLGPVEAAAAPLVVRDPDEHRRAVEVATEASAAGAEPRRGPFPRQ